MLNVHSFSEVLPFWRILIFLIADLPKPAMLEKKFIINGRQY